MPRGRPASTGQPSTAIACACTPRKRCRPPRPIHIYRALALSLYEVRPSLMPWLSEHTSFPALGRPVRAAFQAPRTGSQTGGRTGVHNKRLKLSKPNRGARPGAAIDRLRSLAACRCAAQPRPRGGWSVYPVPQRSAASHRAPATQRRDHASRAQRPTDQGPHPYSDHR